MRINTKFYLLPDYISDHQKFLVITKQLGFMRGCSDVLRSLHKQKIDHVLTKALFSVKTPNLLHKVAQTHKNMPPQGTQLLRMQKIK